MQQDRRVNLNGNKIPTKIHYIKVKKPQNITLMIEVWTLLKFCTNP